ncbi:hypothetical protein Sango_1334800 [Sesamum angolense]|uniref:Uncharacterized protein n=1 Tax=Sesamum angolense TaxID=2727404 RepID=A0AAE1WSU9_9LAMI|nr:hypothetical protein Sango_1334800 [Sesamum angolense]
MPIFMLKKLWLVVEGSQFSREADHTSLHQDHKWWWEESNLQRESLFNVRKVDSSLKCEIWMLSRVRNYLEDQLLGFTLVPISEVLLHNGKMEKEFSLSSTDLFHSPAGFVQLSVSYIGTPPEVIPIPAPSTCVDADPVVQDTESIKSVPGDLDKIEFPDPKVVNENNQMVEEYFGMPCTNVESQSSESLVSSDTENQVSSEVEIQHGKSFSMGTENSKPFPKIDSLLQAVFQQMKLHLLQFLTKGCSAGNSGYVHESMQQFTESLAKMKMDFENGPTSSENSSSDQKSPASKNSGSRVFYGSRAFF